MQKEESALSLWDRPDGKVHSEDEIEITRVNSELGCGSAGESDSRRNGKAAEAAAAAAVVLAAQPPEQAV